MADSFLPGGLLGHLHELVDGTRVRLRLARSSDIQAVRELLERDSRALSAARLLHFDPQREYVLCATALIDGRETLLGIGSIELDGEPTEPDLLLINDQAKDGLRRLLADALVEAARTIIRTRAA